MDSRIKPRKLTFIESAFLKRMLDYDFEGKEVINEQILSAKAIGLNSVDKFGSISLSTKSKVKARVSSRVPIELEGKDKDGVPIAVLLHVIDGSIAELEIYKADGSPIIHLPPIVEFERKIWD